jgi:hypothetical protein
MEINRRKLLQKITAWKGNIVDVPSQFFGAF